MHSLNDHEQWVSWQSHFRCPLSTCAPGVQGKERASDWQLGIRCSLAADFDSQCQSYYGLGPASPTLSAPKHAQDPSTGFNPCLLHQSLEPRWPLDLRLASNFCLIIPPPFTRFFFWGGGGGLYMHIYIGTPCLCVVNYLCGWYILNCCWTFCSQTLWVKCHWNKLDSDC